MNNYSVTCDRCGVTHQGLFPDPFEFISNAQALGWQCDLAIRNKLNLCPDCKATVNLQQPANTQ